MTPNCWIAPRRVFGVGRDGKRIRKALLFTSASLAIVRPFAEGIRSPTIGASGLGNSGARIAYSDDASAVAHNPANLLDLKSWEGSLEPTLVHHEASFKGLDGGTAETRDPWKILPHVFTGGPLANDRFALGFAVTVPYGLSVKWEDDSAFRYTAPHLADLKTMNFNPTAAYRIAEGLHVGAGLDVMWSQLELHQYYPWKLVLSNPAIPDGVLKAEGDGVGIGGNAGITWQFMERHRLAFVARTPMNVDYEGSFESHGTPGVPGGLVKADFASQIRYPTILSVGYGIQACEAVRLQASAEWLQFSRFETLVLDTPQSLPGVDKTIPQNWRDTFTFGTSADWRFSPGWIARAGYQYFQTPVPDHTFSPTIPDANQNVFTVGLGWRSGHHRIEGSYGYVLYDDRHISVNQNPAYNGSRKSVV